MSIQRFETGPRMSQVVVHGNTVYLAGVVANKAAGESVTKQTQDILATIDSHRAKAGTCKTKPSTAKSGTSDLNDRSLEDSGHTGRSARRRPTGRHTARGHV